MDQLTRTMMSEQEGQFHKTAVQLVQAASREECAAAVGQGESSGREETADWIESAAEVKDAEPRVQDAEPRVQGAETPGKTRRSAAGFPQPAVSEAGLEFQYESDAATSFLIVKCNARILEYQALMLRYNRLKYIMPVDIVIKEGVSCFYYNITSQITLSFLLKRQKLKREQFLKLLLNITSAISDSAGYLLADSNFLLDPASVYVNPQTLEPALVYIPTALEQECGISLQDFISELLLLHVNTEGFAEGNLVQRVLSAVKSETFNLKSLILLLSDLLYHQPTCRNGGESAVAAEIARQEQTMPQAKAGKHPGILSGKAKHSGYSGMAGNTGKAGNTGTAGKINTAEAMSTAGNTSTAGAIGSVRETSTPRDTARVKSGHKPIILAVIAQFIMAGVIYFKREALITASDNAAITFTAVAVIVIALEVLIVKKLYEAGYIPAAEGKADAGEVGMDAGSGAKQRQILTNKQNQQRVISGSKTSPGEVGNPRATGMADPKPQTLHPVSSDLQAGREEAACFPASGETDVKAPEILQEAFSGKTELLAPGSGGLRMLRGIGSHPGEQDIPISKDDFIIGRLEGHVDYVLKNNAVGKLHVQLLIKNGICTIKDLNSVNGTFINGKRIESNRELKLNANDRVLLANSEFIYIDG